MEQLFKKEEQKSEDDSFDARFIIPETKGLLADLDKVFLDELRSEHKFEMDELEKAGKVDKNKKVQKQGGTICCCGVPYCGIGPFVERN